MKFFAIAALAALAHAQTDPVALDLSIEADSVITDGYTPSAQKTRDAIGNDAPAIGGTWEIALDEQGEKCLKLSLTLDWDVEWQTVKDTKLTPQTGSLVWGITDGVTLNGDRSVTLDTQMTFEYGAMSFFRAGGELVPNFNDEL